MSLAAPTGLNVIPTTDLVPAGSFIAGIANGNTSFSGFTFYQQPQFTLQSQFFVTNAIEAGIDYAQTPDLNYEAAVFNVKALLVTEDDTLPNVAVGLWNVTDRQVPGYYITLSKTLNYEQEQEERFRAHHRRNRKLLGRRVHFGLSLDGHRLLEPFTGTDIQLNETTVFQADFVMGSGNAATAGIAYVLPDQRTVLAPAILFSNDTHRFSGISVNISHQFSS